MFIKLVLRKEQEAYRSEGLQWVTVDFVNNEPICGMIEVCEKLLLVYIGEDRNYSILLYLSLIHI